ncbi:MAG TPA: M1 family metallopeptidase [Phycisphaerae bacterium]|nr:M1 family metallopeptidase [Phycisphaerae bacterium]
MMRMNVRSRGGKLVLAVTLLAGGLAAAMAQTVPVQTSPASQAVAGRGGRGGRGTPPSTRAVELRGQYGPYRANNDLLSYHLDVRIDPEKKTIAGRNTVKFKMLKDDTRIQLDLADALKVEKVLQGTAELKYERDSGALFIDFPQAKAGETVTIDVHYSGTPAQGLTFRTDAAGRPWICSSCEGPGSSTWWPSKDQWTDEVENMEISVAVPNGLMDVSNGKAAGKTDLGDGYTRWDWHVSYPINSYGVSVNVGNYVHFDDQYQDVPMDFYCLPEDLEKAKSQFSQAKGMLEAYDHYFGEYPFKKDGYKLVEASYVGMEHQSAVTYGNGFVNGYNRADWTGVGISPRFDFIIIHESGHEYFGNAVTAKDKSDMWIHEGWTTYLEQLYVEHRWGREDGLKYINGYKPKIRNQFPIIGTRGTSASARDNDQYFKGALFLNTLRSVIDDDEKWFKLLHDCFQHFKYRDIMTEDLVAWFNEQTKMDLTPMFDEYLRHAALPVLELKFDEAAGTMGYRWKADEAKFAMPIKVLINGHVELVKPTAEWQTFKTTKREEPGVFLDLYYINVSRE